MSRRDSWYTKIKIIEPRQSSITIDQNTSIKIKGNAFYDNWGYMLDECQEAEAFGEICIEPRSGFDPEHTPIDFKVTIDNNIVKKMEGINGDFEFSLKMVRYGDKIIRIITDDGGVLYILTVKVKPIHAKINLTNPANNSIVPGDTINLTGTIEHWSQIKSMSCFIISMKTSFEIDLKKDESVNNLWYWKLDLENLKPGLYPLEIYSKDIHNNTTKRNFKITTIDVEPATQIKKPRNNSIVHPYEITWEGPGTTVEVIGKTTDKNTNIKSISWKFDTPGTPESGEVEIVSNPSTRSYEWSFKAVLPVEGWNEILIIAIDEVENEGKTRIYIDAQRNA